MKNVNFLTLVIILLFSQISVIAQTTRSRIPRELEAATSPKVSYFECKDCGLAIFQIETRKQGLPVYKFYIKDITTGRIKYAYCLRPINTGILPDPCSSLCSIYPTNKY